MNQELPANTTLSHYRIISKIGAGGMGEVYLAQDTKLDRKVALKILPAELASNRDRMDRFVREAKSAAALNHPNIAHIYEIGESGGMHFIAMEFIDGETLREKIHKNAGLAKLLKYLNQVAEGLAKAHAAGIVHRDLKPDNIMITRDDYAKVLDFGLAKLVEPQRAFSSGDSGSSEIATAIMLPQSTPGIVMGTIGYMSPEQASGRVNEIDHRSDIFSFGCLLFEAVTGQRAFEGKDALDSLHKIVHAPTPQLKVTNPLAPEELQRIVRRCLAKEPEKRYQSIKEVAIELDDLQQELKGFFETVPSDQPAQSSAGLTTSSSARADEGFRVAVLPFKSSGTTSEVNTLAEGLSEEIVTGLSRFSYLRVIARGSTLRYAGESGDMRAIGKDLGARYVMEGSLRQAGATVRLAVQLVDATTGAHLWAETFDRQFQPDRIFAVQDDLVPRIVSTCADHFGVLARSISDAVRGKEAGKLTPYEALMRGFGYHYRLNADEHAEAREILEKAVEEAPNNADCWAMLSWTYSHEYAHGFNPQPGSLDRALAAARRAVDLAPSNHLAYEALAVVLFFRKDTAGCLSAAERAMALNPLDASNEAIFLIAFTGDWERGCALIRRAMALNPYVPGWYRVVLALNEYRKAKYQDAVNQTIKANVTGAWADMLLASAYGQLGEQLAAREAVQRLIAAKADFAESPREMLGKWFDAELVPQLIDGLRKAGLKIADREGSEFSLQDVRSATEDKLKLELSTPSIAVLPFVHMSADPDNEYFCDGLAEELLNALAKIENLKVAARTSAFSFKGKNINISEIGRTLGVNTILEGSVRKSGDRIRITVQLINIADGYHLWSERYDRELKDIFDIQDEISLAIVAALKVQLLGAKKAALLKRHTDNPEAHEFYLRGLFYFNKFTPDDFQKAGESFRRAIAIDPRYASAYAGLADAYTELSFFSFSPSEAMPKARAAANKALELDNRLGEAHNSLAIIKMYFDWDYAGAEQEFKRAIALNPGSALIHQWYGWYLGLMERFDESFKEMQRAQELDPLSATINSGIGIVLHWSRQPERAIEQFRKVLELDPNYSIACSFLAEAYAQKGDFVSAIATIEKIPQAATDPLTLSTMGYVYAKSGDRHKALEILNEFVKRSNREYVPALNFAQIYAGLGDNEQALAWLDKACNERAVWIPFLKVDLKFDPLRSNPRFQELLKKVGFPSV